MQLKVKLEPLAHGLLRGEGIRLRLERQPFSNTVGAVNASLF